VTSQFPDTVLTAADSASDDLTRRSSPVVLLLKQLPPNCSTIVVACQPPSSPADVISGGGGGGGGGVGRGDACCGNCGQSPSVRSFGLVTPPRHGRRRSGGSGYSMSARGSPLCGYQRGPRAAAYVSPVVRARTGSDGGTCATCLAASSLQSSSCSVDLGGPGAADSHRPGAEAGPPRRSWFRHIGVGDWSWRVPRRDSVAVYDDRLSAASDTVRIIPSAPSLSRLPPSYSSICVTSWTQHQTQQALRAAPSLSASGQTIEFKSFEDI